MNEGGGEACHCPSCPIELELQSSFAMGLGRARGAPLLIGEDDDEVEDVEGGERKAGVGFV